ncbi:MAG: MoxR family ATPase [Elusimicrobia bacterium]|nr:MoxR family ATPase [Elusimicrobiota bacterium]
MVTLPSLIESNITQIIRGKDEIVKQTIICLLAEGHLLIEDIPGVGKTTLALALAKSLDLSFQRVQFTSDLLPSDILGVSIYSPKNNTFEFKKGPIFHHIVLADEINRSTPKTQSALLEAMNERHVSMDNQTWILPEPFLVIATQNPYEHYGTYPLPESQRDRFLMRISMGYPAQKYEKEILRKEIDIHSIEKLSPVTTKEDVIKSILEARRVSVDESLDDYILKIAEETRKSPFLDLGVSPRGCIALRKAAQANGYLENRTYTIPDDIKKNAVCVLSHRVMVKSLNSDLETESAAKIIQEILDRIPVPM